MAKKKSAKNMVSVTKGELRKIQMEARKEERLKQKAIKEKAREKAAEKRAARKVDGLGSHLKSKIRSAMREVWHRSEARRLCVQRVDAGDGYSYCESPSCKGKKFPKVYIDHIVNVGEVDEGFLERMFVPSNKLQGLCPDCHKKKTAQERAAKEKASKKKTVTKKATRKKTTSKLKDFY